jgi:uncharacterized protein
MNLPKPFHYAFKVKDIFSTREFYIGLLGCKEGRSTADWIDFDFFGNQLSAHVSSNIPEPDFCGKVERVSVPIPHFGCIVSPVEFKNIQTTLENAGIVFIVPPQIRYANLKGEQSTMFFSDFSGNPIELKAYKNEAEIFEV